VREWVAKAVRPVEVLPPSAFREDVLLKTQVTTRSPMGAIAFETGGILIDHGWLRVLGSGHPRLKRTLPGWNENRSKDFYLVADDAAGGFFAINGGAFGADVKNLYYFAPDSLRWEPMKIGYSSFLEWVCLGPYEKFCESLRWQGWETDIARITGDRCMMAWPPPFTKEGKQDNVYRSDIPAEEAWGLQMDFAAKFDNG
jgi:hypothetical protein